MTANLCGDRSTAENIFPNQKITSNACYVKRKGSIMYQFYYINDDQTHNPGLHHEVHTEDHAKKLGIRSKTYVGYFSNEIDAVAQAKTIYRDADGCATCCPRAHRG